MDAEEGNVGIAQPGWKPVFRRHEDLLQGPESGLGSGHGNVPDASALIVPVGLPVELHQQRHHLLVAAADEVRDRVGLDVAAAGPRYLQELCQGLGLAALLEAKVG